MRKALDRMYAASEFIAAVFIACICLTVLVQVGFNIIDKIAVAAGREAVGFVLPSYAEFTGHFLAAATFFALASALHNGSHIRVTLVIGRLPSRPTRIVELWCCALGAVVAAYFCYWAANLAYESWQFGDVSPGIVSIPLWIPQLPMSLGLGCMTLAFLDGLVQVCRHGRPHYVDAADEKGR